MHLDWPKNRQAVFVLLRPRTRARNIGNPVECMDATNTPLVNNCLSAVTLNKLYLTKHLCDCENPATRALNVVARAWSLSPVTSAVVLKNISHHC